MTQELVEEVVQDDVVSLHNNVEIVKDGILGNTSSSPLDEESPPVVELRNCIVTRDSLWARWESLSVCNNSIKEREERPRDASTAEGGADDVIVDVEIVQVKPFASNAEIIDEVVIHKQANEAPMPGSEKMEGKISIYDIRSKRQRTMVLIAASLSTFILPISDTIQLPALPTIQADLNTNQSLTSASVSVYLFMVGIFTFFWGPFSDRYGRRLTALIPLVGYIVATVVCLVANSIGLLVAFRGVEGAFIAAILAAGQGAVADAYALETRGFAVGIFMIPVLVGPIVGPLIGGGLASSLGWRATFVLLLILCALTWVMVYFMLPETHHFYAKLQLSKKDPTKAAAIIEVIEKPVFMKPWEPLVILFKPENLAIVTAGMAMFASMFVALTEVPTVLADNYGFSPSIIGVCYLPIGVGMMIGSIVGGRLADYSATWYSAPEARLILVTILSLTLPAGLIILGWGFAQNASLGVPLFGTFLVGIGQGAYMPGSSSFFSGKYQVEAAAVLAGVFGVDFCVAGVFVSICILLVEGLGLGGVFTLLAGLCIIPTLLSTVFIYRKTKGADKI